jgi:hypothetical protein
MRREWGDEMRSAAYLVGCLRVTLTFGYHRRASVFGAVRGGKAGAEAKGLATRRRRSSSRGR